MEVYRRPANQFVAGFIGSPAMNFLYGELTRQDGMLRFRTGQRTIELPGESCTGGPLDVALGIRPTDLMVGADRGLSLEGEVFLVEPIGPVSYVDVDIDGVAIKGMCDPDAAPAVGERVTLGCPSGRVHLFDRTTGQRL
jgi:multiple sugar transport system ATP-binding protein